MKVKNGKFFFKGKTKEEPFLVYLSFSEGLKIPSFFIIEPGEIKIDINFFDYDGLDVGKWLNDKYELNVSGTPQRKDGNIWKIMCNTLRLSSGI